MKHQLHTSTGWLNWFFYYRVIYILLIVPITIAIVYNAIIDKHYGFREIFKSTWRLQ